MSTRRIIVGISGASGAIYGVRLVETLGQTGIETHVVVSRAAERTLAHEVPDGLARVRAAATQLHDPDDIGASIASGSFRTDGMAVAPCSMHSLAAIAHGFGDSLLLRAASVCLKERRRLVLLPRETPLHAAHLRAMLALTEMGALVAPAVPAFYMRPTTVDELVDQTVLRTLDWLGLDAPDASIHRWHGMSPPE